MAQIAHLAILLIIQIIQITRIAIDSHAFATYELMASWTSADTSKSQNEMLLKQFVQVDGISRYSLKIFIDPHERGIITSD